MQGRDEIKLLLQIVKGDSDQGMNLSDCDTSRLIRLAVRHKVVYQLLLFAQQHRTAFSDEQLVRLENRCRHIAGRSLTQLHELKRIAGVLSEKRISFACIKGPQLARMIYGREAFKESVDLDIMLVNGHDLGFVHILLTELGFTRSNLNDFPGKLRRKAFLIAKREVHYFNTESRCAVDLHIRPGANTYLTARYFDSFFNDLRSTELDGTSVPVLPDELYFVYLCYHGALHQFSRLAWLVDLRAFRLLKHSEFNYENIFSIAASLRVERCVVLAFSLLNNFFNDKSPVDEPGIEHKYRKISGSLRMKYMVSSCRSMLEQEADYGSSLKGRISKLIFIMLLIKGLTGKIDWIFGVFMRQLVKLF